MQVRMIQDSGQAMGIRWTYEDLYNVPSGETRQTSLLEYLYIIHAATPKLFCTVDMNSMKERRAVTVAWGERDC